MCAGSDLGYLIEVDWQNVCGERPRVCNGGQSAKCVRGATEGMKWRLISKLSAGSNPGYIMEVKFTFGDTQGTTLGSSISISEILMLIPKVMPQVSLMVFLI